MLTAPLISSSQAHKYFDMCTMTLIVLNTVTMASDYDGMPTSSANVLEGINYFLTSYFAVEMFIKLIGLGYRTSPSTSAPQIIAV
jgi:hypothetical protein